MIGSDASSVTTLGKDLSKNRDEVQLVKCKEYRVVFTLYIQLVHEASICST